MNWRRWDYVNRQFGSFSSAKFHLLVSKPYGTFAADYDSVLDHIRKTQAQVASTKVHKNFVVVEVRFTQNVFENRLSLFYDCLFTLPYHYDSQSQRISPTTQTGGRKQCTLLACPYTNTSCDDRTDRGPLTRRCPPQTQIRECSQRGYSHEASPRQLQIGTPLATLVCEQDAGPSREHGR